MVDEWVSQNFRNPLWRCLSYSSHAVPCRSVSKIYDANKSLFNFELSANIQNAHILMAICDLCKISLSLLMLVNLLRSFSRIAGQCHGAPFGQVNLQTFPVLRLERSNFSKIYILFRNHYVANFLCSSVVRSFERASFGCQVEKKSFTNHSSHP